ncbi:hypothetical protein C2G38_2189587 [Gigaspora rosea]|uniref:BTB domain-containing protein n=1 Tax=Gigaspora rosea TaxID=44941 RepID=A0A397V3R8_9GLOM|nr:hypothetical protein C2G38_2189587 [Gigaspora rosea]
MNNEPIPSFSNLLENPKDFDVKIKVGENPDIKEFKVRSNILSAKSEYFKVALSSRWARREDGFIILEKPNISPSIFEILINYTYTGKFSNNNEISLLDIFIAADEIGLFEISQQAEKRLLKNVSAWQFPKDFITICKYDNFTNLQEAAVLLKRKEAFKYLTQGKALEDFPNYSGWGSEGINELSEVLCKNTMLTSLNLSSISLGSYNFKTSSSNRSSVKVLADALCKNFTLKDLNLRHNLLESEEGKVLADVLCNNSTLTSLNLEYNNFGSEGGKELANALCKNSTLKISILDIITLDQKEEKHLLMHFARIPQVGKKLADALCKNSTLKVLNLCNNNLESKIAPFITSFLSPFLYSLVGKALANALCKNTALTSLNLQGNNLGSKGGKELADALCKNSTLKVLNLCNNNLGSKEGKALADALCKNSMLTFLNLQDNNLGSEGGKALADALCKNSTLTSLNLNNNFLEAVCGKALADALCKNSTLISLELQDNNLLSEGGKALANALYKNSTLTYLNLQYNHLDRKVIRALTDIRPRILL